MSSSPQPALSPGVVATPSCRCSGETNHDVEWHDVMSLLEAVGSIEERHGDMFVFRLGQQSEVLRRPGEKVGDGQQLVDLRRLLTTAGYDADGADLDRKGREA